jgi:hypothetical protein
MLTEIKTNDKKKFVEEFKKRFSSLSKNIPLIISFTLDDFYVNIHFEEESKSQRFLFDFEKPVKININLILEWLKQFFPKIEIDGKEFLIERISVSKNRLLLSYEKERREYELQYLFIDFLKKLKSDKKEEAQEIFKKRAKLINSFIFKENM